MEAMKNMEKHSCPLAHRHSLCLIRQKNPNDANIIRHAATLGNFRGCSSRAMTSQSRKPIWKRIFARLDKRPRKRKTNLGTRDGKSKSPLPCRAGSDHKALGLGKLLQLVLVLRDPKPSAHIRPHPQECSGILMAFHAFPCSTPYFKVFRPKLCSLYLNGSKMF